MESLGRLRDELEIGQIVQVVHRKSNGSVIGRWDLKRLSEDEYQIKNPSKGISQVKTEDEIIHTPMGEALQNGELYIIFSGVR
jgi:hypothetical protein